MKQEKQVLSIAILMEVALKNLHHLVESNYQIFYFMTVSKRSILLNVCPTNSKSVCYLTHFLRQDVEINYNIETFECVSVKPTYKYYVHHN